MTRLLEAKAFTPQETALLSQDFGDFTSKILKSNKAFSRLFMNGEPDEFRFESETDTHRISTMDGIFRLYANGIAWFDDEDAPWDGKPIGTPRDYLEIRDNYDKLKHFVSNTLGRGRIDTSTSGHGGGASETNPADYIIFLHRASSYPVFRANLERTVVELFSEEIDRNFQPYGYNLERKRAENRFRKEQQGRIGNRFSYFSGDDLHTALWRLGLDDVIDQDGLRMKALTEQELGKTERPIKGGSQKIIHLSKTSAKFKKTLLEFDLDREAHRNAGMKFAPQFNRLVGLLDVIISQGSFDNGFSDLYTTLKRKAEEGFYADIPSFEMGISGVNLQNQILLALFGIQQSEELRDFWLKNIATNPHIQQAVTSVYGILRMHRENTTRKQEIPGILTALQKNIRGFNVTHKVFSLDGFYYEETLLTKVLDIVGGMCYDEDIFHYFNPKTGSLDYLTRTIVDPNGYTYFFDRYTQEGNTNTTVTYNVSGNSLIGDQSYLESVKAHIDERGFELQNSVWITSLSGRKIKSIDDKKIINGTNPSLVGAYEGIIGLNRTATPFIYDAKGGILLLAPPIEEERTNAFFSGKDSWIARRINLRKIKKQVPEEEFVHLNEFSSRIKEVIRKRKEERLIGDTSYSLEQVDFRTVEPYLLKLLEARLVLHRQDLTV